MRNRPDATVEVVAYDPSWPGRFDAERSALEDAVPGLFSSIEHVGSTSVPGMVSKPTIDVLAVAPTLDAVLVRLGALAGAGYEYRPGAFPDDHRHLFFRKVRDGRRTAHLHVLEAGSPFVDEYRLFRAFLVANPDAARRYAELKLDLAARFSDQRQRYVDIKQGEVDGLMDEARRWAQAGTAEAGRVGRNRK